MKILVVDPDATRRPLLRAALAAANAEATEAASGLFALTMLEWNRHDAVVSRVRIDDMDGIELCALLRADPNARTVWFVLLAEVDAGARDSAIAAGVDLVLPATTPGAEIVDKLVPLVRQASPVSVPRPAAPPRPPGAAPPVSAPVSAPKPGAIRPAAPPPASPIAPAPLVAPIAPAARAASPVAPIAPVSPSRGAPAPVIPPRPPAPVTPVATPVTPAPPAPVPASPRAPAVAAPAPPAPRRPAAGRVSAAAAVETPARTFQGALGAMEMEELVQAIATGGKTGRLLLVLGTGGGMIAFETGRVIHAEFGAAMGAEAFEALVAASHREGKGKFCFIPGDAQALAKMPRTITADTESVLLSITATLTGET